MKVSDICKGLLVCAAIMFTVTISANATIPFAAGYGNGEVTQESYHETAAIDSFGLSYPVTSWYQWPGSSDWNYSITVDTDYGTGLFTVGYTVIYEPVQVYIY